MIKAEYETADEAIEGAKNMIGAMQKEGGDFDVLTFEKKENDYIEVTIE